ncbi:unnamed protein product [Nesidiocoris tenuis]|uniref:Uncharacterized protein n=1 Tax=Nesidiocoris tenuis TaxID=355587 RepID=A0A6H5H683_9HEMI|nr:unnamed protein product [Nesidiocoris tenuis]
MNSSFIPRSFYRCDKIIGSAPILGRVRVFLGVKLESRVLEHLPPFLSTKSPSYNYGVFDTPTHYTETHLRTPSPGHQTNRRIPLSVLHTSGDWLPVLTRSFLSPTPINRQVNVDFFAGRNRHQSLLSGSGPSEVSFRVRLECDLSQILSLHCQSIPRKMIANNS